MVFLGKKKLIVIGGTSVEVIFNRKGQLKEASYQGKKWGKELTTELNNHFENNKDLRDRLLNDISVLNFDSPIEKKINPDFSKAFKKTLKDYSQTLKTKKRVELISESGIYDKKEEFKGLYSSPKGFKGILYRTLKNLAYKLNPAEAEAVKRLSMTPIEKIVVDKLDALENKKNTQYFNFDEKDEILLNKLKLAKSEMDLGFEFNEKMAAHLELKIIKEEPIQKQDYSNLSDKEIQAKFLEDNKDTLPTVEEAQKHLNEVANEEKLKNKFTYPKIG